MSGVKSISILGVTGSVGQSACDVVLSAPDRFDVRSVSAHRDVDKLVERALELKAKRAVIADKEQYNALKDKLDGTGIVAMAGESALNEVAAENGLDLVVAAIVGMAGLPSIMAALHAGVNVAIANKEPLVSAGPLVMAAARKSGAMLLPVDSEHNAIFQVFEETNRDAVERLVLTASGGPFRTWSSNDLKDVTKEQALQHPNWVMGSKITIDSATMMNKALEVIEASVLFAMPPSKIDVLVHPQSIVHSMVEYNDGSVLAQLGASDMCTPVANAMAWPERVATPGKRLDVLAMSELTFEKPDYDHFPSLPLAYCCLEAGLSSCIVMNAANEVCVERFLNDKIGFTDIVDGVKEVVDKMGVEDIDCLAHVMDLDHRARLRTEEILKG